MKAMIMGLAFGLAFGVAAPQTVAAQGRGAKAKVEKSAKKNEKSAKKAAPVTTRREQERDRRISDVVRDPRDDRYGDRNDDRYDDRYDAGNGKGPKFCQNGQGHPVHGRQWCRDKGFGLGTSRGDNRYDDRYDGGYQQGGQRYDVRWERAQWNDASFRDPHRRTSGLLSRRDMGSIVSGGILDRLDLQRRRLGGNEPLTGRWMREGDVTTLRVFSGQLPIAELTDRNGDGRVDVVLVNRG